MGVAGCGRGEENQKIAFPASSPYTKSIYYIFSFFAGIFSLYIFNIPSYPLLVAALRLLHFGSSSSSSIGSYCLTSNRKIWICWDKLYFREISSARNGNGNERSKKKINKFSNGTNNLCKCCMPMPHAPYNIRCTLYILNVSSMEWYSWMVNVEGTENIFYSIFAYGFPLSRSFCIGFCRLLLVRYHFWSFSIVHDNNDLKESPVWRWAKTRTSCSRSKKSQKLFRIHFEIE